MANEVEPWLWRKAQAAVRRYFKGFPDPGTGEIAKAEREVWASRHRTGWIMGYRAGMRSKSNPGGGK